MDHGLRAVVEAGMTAKRPTRRRQRRISAGGRCLHTAPDVKRERQALGDGGAGRQSSVVEAIGDDTGGSPSASLLPSSMYLLQFDGGSRGNPGPAGAGAVLYRWERMAEAVLGCL